MIEFNNDLKQGVIVYVCVGRCNLTTLVVCTILLVSINSHLKCKCGRRKKGKQKQVENKEKKTPFQVFVQFQIAEFWEIVIHGMFYFYFISLHTGGW